MKCPKCGYLGFETVDRCRNCGYDFSLAVSTGPAAELPLQQGDGPGAPLSDFDLGSVDTLHGSEATGLDLDRLIGDDETPPSTSGGSEVPAPLREERAPRANTPPRTSVPGRAAAGGRKVPEPPARSGLPLFAPADDDTDDTPLITSPRPVRAPLSVRRATPDLARSRRTPRPARRDEGLALQLEPSIDLADDAVSADHLRDISPVTLQPASGAARLLATLIDVLLLGAVDFAVVYLTLGIAGLTMREAGMLPLIPLVAFLTLLNGGYLVTFVAASGQTIGKMATGLHVVCDDGRRVDVGGAVLRAGGCALSMLSAGLGYLPAFLTADGRALQDRIAGTRVVSRVP